MKASLIIVLALAALGISACGPLEDEPPSAAVESADRPFTGDPWPEIRAERIERLLPDAMDRAGVDAWLIIVRENNNDPMARHVGGENAGGTAAFMFFRTDDGVRSAAVSPGGEATALMELEEHDEYRVIGQGGSLWDHVIDLLEQHDSRAVAINRGSSAIADGLSSTQYEALSDALGAEWMARTTSAEQLIVEWLSVKLPQEVDIMRRAAELTAEWEVAAYAASVPNETTDRDIADFLEQKMQAHGVGDAWSPAQNPAVNSGKDRGHSHPTERVIRPGDFIQIDFGIRVHDTWVTDIQRFAYVLAPGETEAPDEALAKWDAARAGSRAAFAEMRAGATGAEVDAAQRAVMDENGSLPVRWSTGHPVGYWAHDVGPSLSGSRRGQQELRPGMTFAFDGFHSWELSDSTTKTISVEEMVVITEDGAEWLVAPQEDLILIPSR